MEIRNRQTGAVMYESELRQYLKDNGGPSYDQLTPEIMEAIGVDPIFEGPQATTVPPYQFSQRSGVEQINNIWYTKYIAGPVFTDRAATETEAAQTAAEQEAAYQAQKDAEQAKSVRESRVSKLAETDWRFRSDMNPSQEWISYCQALRDITTQAGFPWTMEWPVTPV